MREDLSKRLKVPAAGGVKLTDDRASQVFGWDKERAGPVLDRNVERLGELQYKMYADGRFGVLVVFQAIDAGGKDGVIRHVVRAFNPQGCTVTSFKAPTPEELKHDYLWRIHQHAPRRGEVAVFNRSHYEDVIVTAVNKWVSPATLKQRFRQINEFERMLHENDIRVVKFFLQIGKEEQKERLQARLDDPEKQWKFDPSDLEKRGQWDAYRKAHEAMLSACSTAYAPWHVIPSDKKWFRNLAVSQILVQAMEALPLQFPKPKYDPRKIQLR